MSAERKDQHLALADEQQLGGPARNDFDDVRFVHHALAGIDRDGIRSAVSFAGLRWARPLYINGMTGGSARAGRVNRDLAVAARETGVPIASGSMSICFKGEADEATLDTFRVLRRENPDGFVMANLSADATPDEAARAVDLLAADALQIHLNSVQETVMPEGSRGFSAWPDQIAAIVEAVETPVIVKEVGFGLSRASLERLALLGVGIADVSGRGGTDFARIENARRSGGAAPAGTLGAGDAGFGYGFMAGWGQSAVCSLLDAKAGDEGVPALLASGGVRTPLDVVRSLALGAHAVGVSGVFLHAVLEGGAAGLVAMIRAWLEQIAKLQALLGAASPAALTGTDVLLTGAVREYCQLRGIDAASYARRSERPGAGR
ncbi:MAG TPA: type 2 isopentenyl-diphosphate Delta-isomerase [Microbacteriaceae bacterium]|nr:type 2 isopentenyl-diphosphate Delta-isomerase [Microbacteriaceae bacterium]